MQSIRLGAHLKVLARLKVSFLQSSFRWEVALHLQTDSPEGSRGRENREPARRGARSSGGALTTKPGRSRPPRAAGGGRAPCDASAGTKNVAFLYFRKTSGRDR